MDHLDILIPMSPERFFPQVVMDHILIQNIPFRLFFTNAKGDGATSARNFVKAMWQSSPDKSKYVLMTDNDICLPENLVRSMIEFLDTNEDYGALGVQRGGEPPISKAEAMESGHINAGPVLFRQEVFEKITYHNNDGCECQGMTNDVRKMGSRIGFIGGFTYEHVDRTKRPDYGQTNEHLEPLVEDTQTELIAEEQKLLNCIQVGIANNAEYTYLVGHQDPSDKPVWKPEEYTPSENWNYYGVDADPMSILNWNKYEIPNTKWINVFLAQEPGIAETFEISGMNKDHQADIGLDVYVGKITLTQLINNLKLDEIEILVMNINGHEFEVFHEYDWQIKPKYLIVETHSDDIENTLSGLFEAQGYVSIEKRNTDQNTTEIIYYQQ